MTSTTTITATQITYLHLCHRKLWLTARGVRMENASQNAYVEMGKHISETSYQRRPQRWKELDLGYVKIDHFDPESRTVREVKKSPKLEHAHIAQVKYYLYVLEKMGISNPKGVIEYPRQRRLKEVELGEEDRREIMRWEAEVERICRLETCPELVKKPYCRSCSYYDFCFA